MTCVYVHGDHLEYIYSIKISNFAIYTCAVFLFFIYFLIVVNQMSNDPKILELRLVVGVYNKMSIYIYI